MALTNNKNVLAWVDEMVALTKPDKVVWIDGSKEQLEELRNLSISIGEMEPLNEEKLPGCLLHRTAINDVPVWKTEPLSAPGTKRMPAPPTTGRILRSCTPNCGKMYDGVMKGRTMYVIPYCMGPIGSKLSKVGVEVTDSTYVVLNMNIMTRMGVDAFKQLGDESNDFVRGLHSKADIKEEDRYICQFPEDNAIWSINSGYGGNVLLGKKCFALRIAPIRVKWKAGWLSICSSWAWKNPQGEVKYVCAAFPSACGKTNLAMLILRRSTGKKDTKYGP